MALGRPQIARHVVARLQALQEQSLHLELVQVANDHATSDPIPGTEPKREGGRIVYENDLPVFPTYGEEQARLEAAVARVRAHAEKLGVLPLVEQMIALETEAAQEGPAL